MKNETNGQIQFWLNNEMVTSEEPGGLLLLDHLRKNRHLIGTKEGCKEGDCGACTVLIGRLKEGDIDYQPVTSCLVPFGELHQCHVVTIEGLNLDELSPVQEAMVRHGGSQCGFCTPGFIVSMTWYLLGEKEEATLKGMKRAISGNLCRCTGYSSIKRASEEIIALVSPGGKYEDLLTSSHRRDALVEAGFLPQYFRHMPQRLEEIPPLELDLHSGEEPDYFVAGGTDIYVQEGEKLPESQVKALNLHPQMRGIALENGHFRLGALTSFEEFAAHPRIREIMPRVDDYMYLIASLQIRNRSSLGGNIINASPIGDMTILLLAMDTELVLKKGSSERTVPMKDFFLGYKVMDREEGEILTEILFPAPQKGTKYHFEKVSKRKCLDIATVNSGIKVRVDGDGKIEKINLTMGGVAPVPLYLEKTSQFLTGKEVTSKNICASLKVAQEEISPISDVRGSADYKRLLTNQFIQAHFAELYPERVNFRDLYQVR